MIGEDGGEEKGRSPRHAASGDEKGMEGGDCEIVDIRGCEIIDWKV